MINTQSSTNTKKSKLISTFGSFGLFFALFLASCTQNPRCAIDRTLAIEKLKSFSIRKDTSFQLAHALFEYDFLLAGKGLNNSQHITLQVDGQTVRIDYANMFRTKDYGKTSCQMYGDSLDQGTIYLKIDNKHYSEKELRANPKLVSILCKALSIADEDFEKEGKKIVDFLTPRLETRDSIRRLMEIDIPDLDPNIFKKLSQKENNLVNFNKTPFALHILHGETDSDNNDIKILESRLKQSETNAQIGVITSPYLKKGITREFMISSVSNKPISSMDYLNCRGFAFYGENKQGEGYGFLTHIDVTTLIEENDPIKIKFLLDIIEERYAELRQITGTGPIYIGAAGGAYEVGEKSMEVELEFINNLLKKRLGRGINEVIAGPTPLPKDSAKRKALFEKNPFFNAQDIFFDPGQKELDIIVHIARPVIFNTPYPYRKIKDLCEIYNRNM